MLKKNLPLPVVEIPVSMYDLLCTLKLAGVSKGTGTVSMVSFDNITANARLLCDLMDYDLDIHTVDDGADVDAILLGLKNGPLRRDPLRRRLQRRRKRWGSTRF